MVTLFSAQPFVSLQFIMSLEIKFSCSFKMGWGGVLVSSTAITNCHQLSGLTEMYSLINTDKHELKVLALKENLLLVSLSVWLLQALLALWSHHPILGLWSHRHLFCLKLLLPLSYKCIQINQDNSSQNP